MESSFTPCCGRRDIANKPNHIGVKHVSPRVSLLNNKPTVGDTHSICPTCSINSEAGEWFKLGTHPEVTQRGVHDHVEKVLVRDRLEIKVYKQNPNSLLKFKARVYQNVPQTFKLTSK